MKIRGTKNNSSWRFGFLTMLLFFGLVVLFPAEAQVRGIKAPATPPFLLLSWRTRAYAPGTFRGRSLPNPRSAIEAALERIVDGKLVDVSQADITWSVNNIPFQSGRGLKKVTFSEERTSTNQYVLSVAVTGPRQETTRGSITIPIAKPEIVLDVPFPRKQVPKTPTSWRALLYSFNISNPEDLDFRWSVNGVTATSSFAIKDVVVLDFGQPPAGATANLEVESRSQADSEERARAATTITFR